jgi:hypothetical protein
MINVDALHPLTVQALQTAGWWPDRQTPIQAWYEALTNDGYHWFGAGEEFLASIGGLVIRPIRTPQTVFGSGVFIVDPEYRVGEHELIIELEQRIGEVLMPVGEWDGESIVFIAPSGRMFADAPYHVLALGQTVNEALDLIVRAHRYPEVIAGTVWWQKANEHDQRQ